MSTLVIGLVVLAVVGAVGYYFYKKDPKVKATVDADVAKVKTEAAAVEAKVQTEIKKL